MPGKALPDDARCRFHSRAWGCRCDLPIGHDGDFCESAGDGFASGWDPAKGPPGGPEDLAETDRIVARTIAKSKMGGTC